MPITHFIKFSAIIYLIYLSAFNYIDILMLTGCSLAILALNLKHPLLLKNFFLVITILLFGVSGSFYFPDERTLTADMVIYITSFLAGYAVYQFIPKRSQPLHYSILNYNQPSANKTIFIERLLLLLCLAKLGLIAVDIATHGFINYYLGQALVSNISSYGTASVSKGILTILQSAVNSVSIAALTLYVYQCHAWNHKIKYKLITIMLVVIPIVSLQRSSLATGIMLTMVIVTLNSVSRRQAYKFLAASITAILTIGIIFGGIRENRLLDQESSIINAERAQQIIVGELSSIVAYQGIKSNINTLEYQLGSTIVPPLLYKFIPRSIMPDKPLNSSGYYTTQMRPKEAEGGFFLAPTIFGDIYLNFGLSGTLAFTNLLGFLVARLDRIYLHTDIKNLPIFLIIYYGFYSIIRNNSVESIAYLILAIACLNLLNILINIKQVPKAPYSHHR